MDESGKKLIRATFGETRKISVRQYESIDIREDREIIGADFDADFYAREAEARASIRANLDVREAEVRKMIAKIKAELLAEQARGTR